MHITLRTIIKMLHEIIALIESLIESQPEPGKTV
jgi:hypothetical protein